jgi:flagellar basal-body rod protein FlgB
MGSIFGIHEQALAVRKERQSMLANNLANADTPNFKARDLDWRKQMSAVQEELGTKKFNTSLAKTNSKHINGFAEFNTSEFLKYRVPTQPSLDGNTVETHIEKAKFMENAMQYQATLEWINSRIKGVRGALRGE